MTTTTSINISLNKIAIRIVTLVGLTMDLVEHEGHAEIDADDTSTQSGGGGSSFLPAGGGRQTERNFDYEERT